MSKESLTIGRVGAQTGVGRRAIRLYEAHGLIPRPARAENRYRLYPPETVELLRFIKRAQAIGLKLVEIKEILGIRRQGRFPCEHVRAILQQKVTALDQRLTDLLELRRELRGMLRDWSRRSGAKGFVCPHIEVISLRPRALMDRKAANSLTS